MTTSDLVWQALASVLDPELGLDIVSLGLIYAVEVKSLPDASPAVKIRMTLTTPGCPLAGTIETMIQNALATFVGEEVVENLELEFTFDPPWTVEMMSEEARLTLAVL